MILMTYLKKPGLDTADMSNYHRVSNLSFMSKLIERAVASQLNLMANNLLPRFQSAYRKGHSMETAMLRVWSDFLTAADGRRPPVNRVVPVGSLAADCVQRPTICYAAGAVWSSARIRAGPLLYILYTADLANVVARHGLQMHQYADDIQMYVLHDGRSRCFHCLSLPVMHRTSLVSIVVHGHERFSVLREKS